MLSSKLPTARNRLTFKTLQTCQRMDAGSVSIHQDWIKNPSPCGMPDVTPHRLHISRRYGSRSIARPAQRMGDSCRQVSWLAAQAPLIRLPDCGPHGRSVAYWWRLTAYSCGGSHGLGLATEPCSLFIQPLSELETGKACKGAEVVGTSQPKPPLKASRTLGHELETPH
jgi:hypothetical protein